MTEFGKKSLLSTITAIICIFLYVAVILFGTGRIIANSNTRQLIAAREFNDIIDLASSASFLGFMSRPYQDTIQDALLASETLLGVIITGSNGEFGFERNYGTVINWNGDIPRFRTGFGISSNPFFQSVWIEGQRNSTVQAIYSYIDYDFLISVLKDTLIIIIGIMTFAIIVLLLEIYSKPDSSLSMKINAAKNYKTDNTAYQNTEQKIVYREDYSEPEFNEPEITIEDEGVKEGYPKGLYSPRGIGWESYTKERLDSELHRCASVEEDLVFIVMDTGKIKLGEGLLRNLISEIASTFTLRDMIFEKGESGLSLIVPSLSLEQCIEKAEIFINKIQTSLFDSSDSLPDFSIGMSSREGRLVEASRLMFEANEALAKALSDSASPIIAFKSDPEKYRNYIRRNNY